MDLVGLNPTVHLNKVLTLNNLSKTFFQLDTLCLTSTSSVTVCVYMYLSRDKANRWLIEVIFTYWPPLSVNHLIEMYMLSSDETNCSHHSILAQPQS